ncbi:hypothetical protein CEN49_24275 [Fischerella thermalis CCMEE 5273]|nr:hypothetical protein CEN49_24275 [Fischerella thermalis CCMEE 5273]
MSDAIKNIPLEGYISENKVILKSVLESSLIKNAKAIYYEYDLDNSWSSSFFICREYYPMSMEDDDWASDWIHCVDGPSISSFSRIYRSFDENDSSAAITLYLIARTRVAFTSAVRGFDTNIPVCMAYHDEDPIIRVIE